MISCVEHNFDLKICTEFGIATINPNGYYRISSRNEGNNGKLLHRLVWEDWYGKKIPEGYDIHHINNNPLDNRIQNLQCVEHNKHIQFHKKNVSNITREKMSKNNAKYWKGKKKSSDLCIKESKSRNSTGFYRVYKQKKPSCKQGFIYCYQYYVNGKQKGIVNTDINKLKQKVIDKGLKWEEF